jgi:S-formylglutathione hydrolase FrmB
LSAPHYGRRRFLVGGAAVALGAAFAIGVEELSGSSGPLKPPKSFATDLRTGHFHSARRGTEVGYTVSLPLGWKRGDQVPLALILHGLGGDHSYAFAHLDIQSAQANLAQATPPRPIVLAAMDGGAGYWHPRANGDDPQGMVVDEFIPLLKNIGVSTGEVVAFGWSMGGYGSLLLAETYPTLIRKVAVMSPAIWQSYADSRNANPDAFDSLADWRTHNVVAHLGALSGIPVRVACGLSDPFLPASRQLATLLPPGDVLLAPGAHDDTFWKAHGPAMIAFLAT